MSSSADLHAVESAPTSSPTVDRISLFGVPIDPLTMDAAVNQILDWCDEPDGCRYVVTPNIDHVVLLQERSDLRDAYQEAALVLADGWPVVTASRIVGRSLPERVAGSDLVPRLFDRATSARPLRVFLLGAAPGVAQRAASEIQKRWPAVEVVGTYSPPIGFEQDPDENERILQRLDDSAADVIVVGLGAPKQELWVWRHASRLKGVALCVGATIDFLAHHRRRAPIWMQRCGLEWLHRLASEPKRLFRRYARDAVVFPRLVLQEILRKTT